MRPQIQLRFRNHLQHEAARAIAASEPSSLNEWILKTLESAQPWLKELAIKKIVKAKVK